MDDDCCSSFCIAGMCNPSGGDAGGYGGCMPSDPNPTGIYKNGQACMYPADCCSNFCDQRSGMCEKEPSDGGCQLSQFGEYCYSPTDCCSNTCTNEACAKVVVPEVVVTDDYVKACNGTLVGIFPERAMGTIAGVKGLSKENKCAIDKDRPVLSSAKYNLCARDPYTLGADTTRCIFNDGRGTTKDISIGGTLKSSSPIVQTATVDAVDGEWQLTVTGLKNAKIDFNITWEHPEYTKPTVTKISNLCSETDRSFVYTLGTGAAAAASCSALQNANSGRTATVCADMSCQDTTTSHEIFNYYPNGTHYHYFPNSDGIRERFFRGTGNKMIAGVLVYSKRHNERTCEPKDINGVMLSRFASLFTAASKGESTAKCVDENNQTANHAPYGADPVYLSSSSMYKETEFQTKDTVFKKASSKNAQGIPYAFHVSDDAALADYYGHAVLYQNNLKSSDAEKLTTYLKEGFYLDALTKQVTVTYLSFNAYDKTYHKFSAHFTAVHPTGGVEVTYDHASFNVDPYFNKQILLVIQMIYWFLVFLTFVEEVREMFMACSGGDNYFKDGWNYMELFCIALQIFNFGYWWYILAKRTEFNPREQYVAYPLQTYKEGGMLHDRNETAFNEALTMYFQADHLTEILMTYETIQTCVLVLIMFRWFKQLDFHPEFGVITRTCAQSWKSLSQWLVVFLVVQAVYIFGGYYSFGQTLQEFSTFENTLFVQYQLLNGDLTILASLWQTNNVSVSKVAAYVYIFSYYFIVFILMLNVLLGIVIDAYTDQRDRSAEDPLIPDESPWEEMSMFLVSETKGLGSTLTCCCRAKSKITINQIVEIPSNVSDLSDEEAEALNNRARLAAQLHEILHGALALNGGTRLSDAGGNRVRSEMPNWGSDYYALKYEKPVQMEITAQNLLRTSHGDLTHEELTELLHYQLQKYGVDQDKGKVLSQKIAELAIWRYGKELNVETRREIGIEHRNVMNEHRFQRLEESLAQIAVTGNQQWGEVQKAIVTVAAQTYNGPMDGNVVIATNATTVVSAKSVDTVNL
jgi:hypothetical protein